jgi:hypothetical protein
MNTKEKMKIDDQLMKKLDANTIRRSICLTNKGALELCIVKGGTEYYLTLDSVPITKELNHELMEILFKPEITVSPINNTTVIKTSLPTKKGKISKVK